MTSDWFCKSRLKSEMHIWFGLVTTFHESTTEACKSHSEGRDPLKKSFTFGHCKGGVNPSGQPDRKISVFLTTSIITGTKNDKNFSS